MRQPNVVLVVTDDQGYGDFGFTGNQIVQTPHIDALRTQSTLLNDFHVGPTCAPTRAGLLTGHFHNSTGVWHTIGGRSLLRKDEYSLADALRGAGYATGIFGKWHLGDTCPYRPHDRGFDEAVVHGGGGIGQTPDYWNNDYFDDTYYNRGVPQAFEGYCTDVFFRLGMDFIQRMSASGRPFFCYIPTNAPHSPWQVDEKYARLYDEYGIGERARFYGMITNIDENVGKLLAHLDALGIAQDTILIFMTDNGTAGGCSLDKQQYVVEGYNAGMRGIKGSAYEGGHRVPVLLRWPQGSIGFGQIDKLTANVDVMPTLLDLCGVPYDVSRFDGLSLRPLLEGKTGGVWDERILVTDSQRVTQPIKWKSSSAMQGKLRLINGQELYDVASDPEQRHDISAEHPDAVARLREGYERWWEKVSTKFDQEIPQELGPHGETALNAHDLRGDVDEVAWHQGQIRAGRKVRSYWETVVLKDGIYRFELRRWPKEADKPIREGYEGEPDGAMNWWTGGRAMPFTGAHLHVGALALEAEVGAADKAVVFEVPLKAGPWHVHAWFSDVQGDQYNAFYTYVTYIKEAGS